MMVLSWTFLGQLLVSGVRYMIPDWKIGIRMHALCGYIIVFLTFATSLYILGIRQWKIQRKSLENEHYHGHIGTGKFLR